MLRRHAFVPSLVLALALGAAPAFAVGNVVISQVYAGGGNTGAPWQNDYVELFNRSGAPVDISGWSVQYASSAGTTWTPTAVPAATILPAGSYLIVKLGPTSTVGAPLPAGCIIASNTGINMAVAAGKVALVTNSTALSGTCPLPNALVSDFVGWGAAATCSETAVAGATSNTTALQRKNAGGLDTDNNSTDFVVGAPVPCSLPTPANANTWGRLKTMYR
jgi:hypothetical protein